MPANKSVKKMPAKPRKKLPGARTQVDQRIRKAPGRMLNEVSANNRKFIAKRRNSR